jgi:hypothetical protein
LTSTIYNALTQFGAKGQMHLIEDGAEDVLLVNIRLRMGKMLL